MGFAGSRQATTAEARASVMPATTSTFWLTMTPVSTHVNASSLATGDVRCRGEEPVVADSSITAMSTSRPPLGVMSGKDLVASLGHRPGEDEVGPDARHVAQDGRGDERLDHPPDRAERVDDDREPPHGQVLRRPRCTRALSA